MPTIEIAGLVMAYVALAVLVLSLHMYSSWNWLVKAGATILLLMFYYVTYTSMPGLLGWPTSYELPQKFRLIAFSVDEKRGVYIWANDLKDGVRLSTPRAYVLPYTKTLHENVEIAGAKIRRGGAIIGEILEPKQSAAPKADAETSLQSEKIQVNFIDAPEALIPEKD